MDGISWTDLDEDEQSAIVVFDPDAFDKWFTRDSPARTHRARSSLSLADNPGKSPRRQRPVTERIETVIKALYPNGVPDQATEPNKKLFKHVHGRISELKLPKVSDESILRAVGRRRR